MDPETTAQNQYTVIQSYLYIAFELSQTQWMLGFTIGFGQRPRLRTIPARDLTALQEEIRLAKHRFGLPEDALMVSGYEAGRDGFRLDRYLHSVGVANLVVDSASIEVNRRAKQAKTDRLDLGKLLTMLMRYHTGEKKVWSVVHVPTLTVEDHRHLHRELADLKAQRTQHTNRIKGYLANQGIGLIVQDDFPDHLHQQRLWNGDPLPPGLQARLLCAVSAFPVGTTADQGFGS